MENPDVCSNDPYQDISDEFGWTQSAGSADPADAQSHDMEVQESTGIEEEVDWGDDEEHHHDGHTDPEDGEQEEQEERQQPDVQQETELSPETKLEAPSELPESPAESAQNAQAADAITLEEDDDECQIVSVELSTSTQSTPNAPKGKGKGKGKSQGAKGKAAFKAAPLKAKGEAKGGKGSGGYGKGKTPIAKHYPPWAQAPKAMVAKPKSKPNAALQEHVPRPPPPQQPAQPAQSPKQPAAPPVKAAPMSPQISADTLLAEQVRMQLLKEPGKRASMRRLLAQPKVSQLLRHLSGCRQVAFSSMPAVLCSLLRESADTFQLTEAGKEDASAAIQDVKVSLTDIGEKTPLVDKKNFDMIWSSLFSAKSTVSAPQQNAKSGAKAAETAQASSAGGSAPPAAPPFAPPQSPQSSEVLARNLSKQRALQQIRDLDDRSAPGVSTRDAPDGPRPPSMPPPNYKADWKRFQPSTKRVLAPRRAGSASSLEDASAPAYPEPRSFPSPPATPPGHPANLPVHSPAHPPAHPPAHSPVHPPAHPPAAAPGQLGPRPPHGVPSLPTPPAGPPPGRGGQSGPRPHYGSQQRNGVPEPVDNEGRPFDLERVVVNFANVGATYGSRVLKKDKQKNSYLFDYEGVRRCVKHLTQKCKLRVIGVIFENFHGDENGREVFQVPPDISAMCESIELTPRLMGQRHKSADDEMTIKCAYRRNCRFLDNDNYQDWRNYLADEAVRTWLLHCQEFLQMKFLGC